MIRRKFAFLIFALLTACRAQFAAEPSTPVAEGGERIVRIAEPFFREHCLHCHGPDDVKGDLRLDQLEADLSKPAAFERWHLILRRVRSGEMPPKSEPRPKPAER